jgi:hypothetical protein
MAVMLTQVKLLDGPTYSPIRSSGMNLAHGVYLRLVVTVTTSNLLPTCQLGNISIVNAVKRQTNFDRE